MIKTPQCVLKCLTQRQLLFTLCWIQVDILYMKSLHQWNSLLPHKAGTICHSLTCVSLKQTYFRNELCWPLNVQSATYGNAALWMTSLSRCHTFEDQWWVIKKHTVNMMLRHTHYLRALKESEGCWDWGRWRGEVMLSRVPDQYLWLTLRLCNRLVLVAWFYQGTILFTALSLKTEVYRWNADSGPTATRGLRNSTVDGTV